METNEREKFRTLESKLIAASSPGIRPGLDRLKRILAEVGTPQDKFPAVHIAGTNGKGSTAAGIDSILRSSGYRTALFTSPHLVDFAERLVIGGKMATADSWLEAADKLIAAIKADQTLAEDPPTYFELSTAAAMLILAEEYPDIAVFETGMGGRLDASNILGDVKLSVITPIGLDHMEYLGDTIEKIAAEKFAIMRADTPALFFGDERLNEQFTADAKERGALPHIFTSEYKVTDTEYSMNGTDFTLEGSDGFKESFHTSLVGTFQSDNAALAIAAARILQKDFTKITDTTIKKGIAATYWPGRMEIISRRPLIIVDGGHNPHAMTRVAETLRTLLGESPVSIVIAMMKDKAVAETLSLLRGLNVTLYCTQVPESKRSMTAENMYRTAQSIPLPTAGSWKEPISAVAAAARVGSPVFCCGSLYLVGYIKEHLNEL